MARKIACLGDIGSHGGTISSVSSNTIIDGNKVALDGDLYSCSTHGIQALHGTGGLTVNGKAVVCRGDTAACGSAITTISSDTLLSI